MSLSPIASLSFIICLGIFIQLISWKIKIPSILLLLISGFIIGPGFHLIDPDQLFGELLFPLVSLSVAIILFEGGLSLKFSEINGLKTVIFNLISIGVVVTWVILSAIAYYWLDLNWQLAILLAAILTVTGPTVIIPLLNHVRPKQPVSNILKWEGILIDPVGATLAVLIFEIIHHDLIAESASFMAFSIFNTIIAGVLIGLLCAQILKHVLQKFLIPDHLDNPLTLSLVVLAYVLANLWQEEAGLLAVTVMGVALANSRVKVAHILEFKETLRVLLISCLFIILAARININSLLEIDLWKSAIFILAVLLTRFITVFISAIGSKLTLNEKLYLCCIAPRGIIAASVSSVFALKLSEQFGPEAELLASYVFIVIIGTVSIYGLCAVPLARLLKLQEPAGHGIAFLGAQPLAIKLALELKKHQIQTLLIDTNAGNIALTKRLGLTGINTNPLMAGDEFDSNYAGIGKLLAVTSNHEANSLATLHFSSLFGSSNVYLLPQDEKFSEAENHHLAGRYLFASAASYSNIEDLIKSGAKIESIKLDKDTNLANYLQEASDILLPLMILSPEQKVEVVSTDRNIHIKSDSVLLVLRN